MGALLSCAWPPPDAAVLPLYEFERCVGKGAEAAVWLARERATGQLYALKLIKRGMKAFQARTRRGAPVRAGAACAGAGSGLAAAPLRTGTPSRGLI